MTDQSWDHLPNFDDAGECDISVHAVKADDGRLMVGFAMQRGNTTGMFYLDSDVAMSFASQIARACGVVLRTGNAWEGEPLKNVGIATLSRGRKG